MKRKTKIKYSEGNYVEAYKCECGAIFSKYEEGNRAFPSIERFSFNACCSKCGRPKSKIKIITGKWRWKVVTYRRFLLFKKSIETRDCFIESEWNE